MRKLITIFLSAISLLCGGLIYVLYRPESLTMFSWFAALGLSPLVLILREWTASYFNVLPAWVCFSLPQSLWLLSGCLAIHSVWLDHQASREQFWMIAFLLLVVGGELGQAIGLVQGVFDPLDIILVIAAFVVAQFIAYIDGEIFRKDRAYS